MNKTILIVDDNKGMRDAIRFRLQAHQGLTVCGEAADGIAAIEKAKELKPDLILLGLVLPKVNGAEVASLLRRALPQIHIVLFTMYPDIAKGLASVVGVDLVLSKADGLSELAQRVHDLCDSSSKWAPY